MALAYRPDSSPFRPLSRGLAPAPMAAALSALLALSGACSSDDDTLAPDAPTDVQVAPMGRTNATISWQAPADDDGTAVAGYELRVASEALTAESFADSGEVIATATPGEPGAAESAMFTAARPGVSFYVGVVAIDAAGNRSEPSLAGPFATALAQSGSVLPPAPADGDNGFGYQMGHGDFDGDGYIDLVVTAPFKNVGGTQGAGSLYVYLGTESGFEATHDVEITGSEDGAQFGNSLAVLDWDGDGRDDIAVGAPFGDAFSGRAFIFAGATLTGGSNLLDTDADTVIDVDGNSPWFTTSILAFTLSAARLDSDDRDDLILGAVNADNGVGAIVAIYGNTATGHITLSELDAGLMNGASAHIMFAPGEVQGGTAIWGSGLHNLGPSASGRDQLGVAFFQGADVFIIRGRADRPAAPGVEALAFDPAIDLRATLANVNENAYFALAQAAIMDLDDDGVREVMVSNYNDTDSGSSVHIIGGAEVGEQPLEAVEIASIGGAVGQFVGGGLLGHVGADGAADIDGDGLEDLVIVSGTEPAQMHVWYGGAPLTGEVAPDTADAVFAAPGEFTGEVPAIGGLPIVLRWAGDLNGDGFEDLVWSDWANNDRDGAFEVVR